ncbi:hypothetical protein [Rhodococcoides trifolii]|uniref:hypothetical protein n=1 Tax=Rhodococcoides trifolii TaxID=908250 RepID=UPI00166E6B00|nr:hypothetical protein [Rhodococcus trifolii]
MKALPLGRTERFRRAVEKAGGTRWVPLSELLVYLNDRSLTICFCGHPDCMEGAAR